MDDLLRELVVNDPYFQQSYREGPTPHFFFAPPATEIVDFETVHPDSVPKIYFDFLTHMINYRYTNVSTMVTQRGFSRKWQTTFDLATSTFTGAHVEGTYPWVEFYGNDVLLDMWERFIRPSAYNAWFPALYPGANHLAKKLRITFVKDQITTKDHFLHPYENADRNVLLSAHMHVFSPVNTVLSLENGGETQNHSLVYEGGGVVTSPQNHQHKYRLYTSATNDLNLPFDKDNLVVDSHTMYFKFDFIE